MTDEQDEQLRLLTEANAKLVGAAMDLQARLERYMAENGPERVRALKAELASAVDHLHEVRAELADWKYQGNAAKWIQVETERDALKAELATVISERNSWMIRSKLMVRPEDEARIAALEKELDADEDRFSVPP